MFKTIIISILLASASLSFSQQDSLNSFYNAPEQYYRLKKFYYDNYLSHGLSFSEMKGTGYKNFLLDQWFYTQSYSRINDFAEDNFLKARLYSLNKGIKAAADWQSLGPNSIDSMGGRMITAEFHPGNPDIIWAGASTGGLWKSTNASNDWFPVAEHLPSMNVSAIKIKSSNPQIMLLGTGNDRFFSSTIGPGVGVLRSTDGGNTWSTTSFSYSVNQGVSVSDLIWHPNSGDTVYMAASNGIWKSNDAGLTWSIIRNGRASTLVIHPQNPCILYSVIRSQGVFRSTNCGGNWTLLTNGVANGGLVDLSSITICDSSPEVLYVSMANASTFTSLGVFKTTNGGDEWNIISNAPTVLCQPQGSPCYGWFVNKIKVSPHDPDHVLYGGILFYLSTNGGANWMQKDVFVNGQSSLNFRGVTYVDLWDIQFHPSDPNIVYVLNDGGVQKSTNKGVWWTKQNKDLVTAQIYKLASSLTDTNIIIGGFQDHGLQRMNNAGGSTFWYRWAYNDGTNVIIDPANPNTFYGDYFFGDHRRNLNGGVNFNSTTTTINNGILETGAVNPIVPPIVINPQQSNILYTSTYLKVYKTTNRGNLWISTGIVPNVRTLAVDHVNSDIVYAHSYTDTSWSIWKTSNAGTNWAQIDHPSIPSWRVIDLEADPVNSGVLYAVRNSISANQDHVKRSTDYGETWTDITSNLPDIIMSAIAVSYYNSSHLYVATDKGVYATTDGGQDWFEYSENLPGVIISDIHYHPLDWTLRISTIGRGVYKTKAIDAGSVSIGNNSSLVPDFRMKQNYPNPFNASTKISFTLNKRGDASLYIYNLAGQLVYNKKLLGLDPGEHSIKWDAINNLGYEIASGIYFVKLSFAGISQTIKMTLVK